MLNGLVFCARIVSARLAEATDRPGSFPWKEHDQWRLAVSDVALLVEPSWCVMAMKSAHWGLFISIFVH